MNPDAWNAHVQELANNWEKYWEIRLSKKYARADFTVYQAKHRLYARFFNKVAAPNSEGDKSAKVVWVDGDASFPCTGKGERVVPTVWQLAKLKAHGACVKMVNEFRTSKLCSMCHCVLDQVKTPGENGSDGKLIRGLLWCPQHEQYVSRDANAAHNIAKLGLFDTGLLSSERPLCFSRPQPGTDDPLTRRPACHTLGTRPDSQ